MKTLLTLLCAAFELATAGAAGSGIPRQPVEDFRPLLVAAIDSPTGDAHGVLIGAMAQTITQRLHAAGPILVDVTTLGKYQQPGCSRLNVRFSQDGVQLPGAAAPRHETLDLGLNYCRDGMPPRSLH